MTQTDNPVDLKDVEMVNRGGDLLVRYPGSEGWHYIGRISRRYVGELKGRNRAIAEQLASLWEQWRASEDDKQDRSIYIEDPSLTDEFGAFGVLDDADYGDIE